MTFGLELSIAHSFPKERQLQKSCISFEEECKRRFVTIHV